MTDRAEKLLAEAKRYIATAEEKQRAADEARWAAAERMWKANHEEGVSQREIARLVGVAQPNVNRYIVVWERFGDMQTYQSFMDAYYDVVGRGPEASDQQAAKRALREADEETVEKVVASLPPEQQAAVARAAIRNAPREIASDPEIRHAVDEATPTEERAERTRRALRDPAVARHVVRDDTARSAMASAAREMEQESERRQRERAPELVDKSLIYRVANRLNQARYEINYALDEARRIDLNDEDREKLLEDAERVELSLGWLTSFLRSGDRSFDEALNELLREGR